MGFESSATRAHTRVARTLSCVFTAALASFGASPALAHHSYAMFDMSKSMFVEGTVAKIEWVNPHTFVWLFVAKPDKPGEYDLYGFENGPINMLMRAGWTKETLRIGEKLAILYFPLKDGRTGGSFVKAIHEDGTENVGDPFAPGVAEAAKLKLPAKSGAAK